MVEIDLIFEGKTVLTESAQGGGDVKTESAQGGGGNVKTESAQGPGERQNRKCTRAGGTSKLKVHKASWERTSGGTSIRVYVFGF